MKKTYFAIILIFTTLGLFSQRSASRLNSLGFDQYEQQNYLTAAELFEEATQVDDTYIYAHHNYACAITLHYGHNMPMTIARNVITHLKRTLELDPSRIQKILSDSDLDALRYYDLYQKEIAQTHLIDGMEYFGGAPGSAAVGMALEFPRGDVAHYFCVMEGLYGDEKGSQYIPGRYAILGDTLYGYFPGLSETLMSWFPHQFSIEWMEPSDFVALSLADPWWDEKRSSPSDYSR